MHLVSVPDDYYQDELFFDNPEDLKGIFAKIEEDNLKMIHNCQEYQESYELLLEKEKLMKERL